MTKQISQKLKFSFGSHASFRTVTVYAASLKEAEGKAVELLDKRCMKSGGEPPVSWSLYPIQKPVLLKTK